METLACGLPARLHVNSTVRGDAWEMAHVKMVSSLMRGIGSQEEDECRNLHCIFIRNYATLRLAKSNLNFCNDKPKSDASF